MVKSFSLGVALLVLWLALSISIKPFFLLLGLIATLLTVFLAARLRLIDEESVPHHLGAKLPRYWLWLGSEIVKSNLAVARLILSPRPKLSQHFVRVEASQISEIRRVIFANSITLTPGTITVETEGPNLLVHVLTASTQEEAMLARMHGRVTALERRE